MRHGCAVKGWRLCPLLATVVVALWGSEQGAAQDRNSKSSVAQALSETDDAGFAKAYSPRSFSFPQDHGAHPDFKHEWWYFTGNLHTDQGRRFGYQLTFFRIGLSPRSVARESAWATSQIYMAHFALSDVAATRFHHRERMSRPALGLAGSDTPPLRVWLNDWSAVEVTEGEVMHCLGCMQFRLTARDEDVAIDLLLQSTKPAALHGEQGLSRKSAQPGNASYYYSLTRLRTQGTIHAAGKAYQVTGLSWLDREWSTSALSNDQAGWDWFSLQLPEDVEIMLYRLRRVDGSVDPFSSGTIIRGDGETETLAADDVRLEVTDYWRSPNTGVRYPSRWRLIGDRFQLEILPLLANQELDVTVRYWEGAVSVRGDMAGRPVTGSGYVELTGYD